MELLTISPDPVTELLLGCVHTCLELTDMPMCQESVDLCSRRLSGSVEEYIPELTTAVDMVHEYYPEYFTIEGFVVYLRAGPRVMIGSEVIRYPKLIARLKYE